MKKWFFSVFITFVFVIVATFVTKNVNITFDKDSKYKVDLPKVMRVAYFTNKKGEEFYKSIRVDRTNLPEVGDDEVLVYVKTATFSQSDFDFIETNKRKDKFVPCSDFSGVVVRVGNNVRRYEIGDKVFGIVDVKNRNGACADYVAVPQNNVYTIPYSLTYKQSASIPTPALLNWLAVYNLKKQVLDRGEVLIDDAVSETGVMLNGLLKQNGFNITAVDEENMRNSSVLYDVKKFISNKEFDSEINNIKGKYDVVINMKQGLPVSKLLSAVKIGGTFISFEKVNIERKDVKVIIIDNAKVDRETFAKMARLVHLGKLQVKIVQEFGLESIREAYKMVEKGNINGKIVINVNK